VIVSNLPFLFHLLSIPSPSLRKKFFVGMKDFFVGMKFQTKHEQPLKKGMSYSTRLRIFATLETARFLK